MGNAIINKLIFSQVPGNVEQRHRDLTAHRVVKYIPGFHGYSIPYLHFVNRERSPLVLVYFHGNASDLESIYSQLDYFSQVLQAEVYALEYTGFGVHTLEDRTKPSEKTMFSDALTFVDFLLTRHSAENVVLFGRSLGSAPALHVASQRPEIGGLILESAFTTPLKTVLKNKTSHKIVNGFSNRTLFENELHIQSVQSPIFIFHGTHDEVVPYVHSQKLAHLAKQSRFVQTYDVEKGSHNDLWQLQGSLIIRQIQLFLSQYGLFELVSYNLNHNPYSEKAVAV